MKKKKDIQDELSRLSPFLSEKMKERKGGFKVPEGYFDDLSNRLMDSIENDVDSKAELEELSPFLSQHLKQRQGSMKQPPLAYFDKLADKVEQKAKPPSKVRRLGGSWLRRMAAASVLLFVMAAGWWWLSPKGEQDLISQMENYDEEQVLKYLDENAGEFDFNVLLESGLISNADVDYQDVSQFSEEERDLYINTILEENSEG